MTTPQNASKNPYHSLPSRSAKRRKAHWKVRHISFKLYDEDAVLADQLADSSSFVNLCTNVFRSYHKAQEQFKAVEISKLSGEVVSSSKTELALIPMPVALWEAYTAKSRELAAESGADIGCEELMLRVLQNEAPPVKRIG